MVKCISSIDFLLCLEKVKLSNESHERGLVAYNMDDFASLIVSKGMF
jgi:hypothetical protein